MDMVRFLSADDPGFEAVCGELRRWVKHIEVAERRHKDLLASTHNKNTPERLVDQPKSSARCKQKHGSDPQFVLTRIVLVPYTSNPDFVGRSGIVDQLKNQLGHLHVRSAGGPQPKISLYGLGGVGYVMTPFFGMLADQTQEDADCASIRILASADATGCFSLLGPCQ